MTLDDFIDKWYDNIIGGIFKGKKFFCGNCQKESRHRVGLKPMGKKIVKCPHCRTVIRRY